jgi:hypothetical protein
MEQHLSKYKNIIIEAFNCATGIFLALANKSAIGN